MLHVNAVDGTVRAFQRESLESLSIQPNGLTEIVLRSGDRFQAILSAPDARLLSQGFQPVYSELKAGTVDVSADLPELEESWLDTARKRIAASTHQPPKARK